MNQLLVRTALLPFVVAGASLVGCGSTDSSPNASPAGSGGLPGTAGAAGAVAAGALGAGAGGLASGGAPSSGASGSAGASGAAAGSAGSSGSGGAAPFGAIKCSPTGTGDGKKDSVTPTQNPAEWSLQSGATAGKVTAKAFFDSPSYTPGKFAYWIYTSPNYVAGSPAVFLLFGDGDLFMRNSDGFHLPTVLDNLTAKKELPPTVALFVDPPSNGVAAPTENDRKNAYDPPTDKYTNLLFNELLPAVVFGKYSISRDPNAWAIGGFSASGGQGWKVLWNRPNDVHKFIGINSSFGAAIDYDKWDWVSVVNMAPARELRVSLITSTKDLADQRGNWQTINTNMFNALTTKGARTRLLVEQATCTAYATCAHYPPLNGYHDMPDALRWVFQGCTF